MADELWDVDSKARLARGVGRHQRTRPVLVASVVVLVLVLIAGIVFLWHRRAERGVAADLCGTEVTGPAGLVGFDPADGRVLWRAPLGDVDRWAVTDSQVVTASFAGRVVGTDGDSGRVRWCRAMRRAGKQSDRTLVAAAGVAVVLSGRDVVGLDATTGAMRWRHRIPLELAVDTELAVSGAVVHVTGQSRPGGVDATNPVPTSLSVAPHPTAGPPGQPAAPTTSAATPSPAPVPPTTEPRVDGTPLAFDVRTGREVPRGDPPPPAGVYHADLGAGRGEVMAYQTGSTERQQSIVTVAAPDGEVRWTKTVPGFASTVTRGGRIAMLEQNVTPTAAALHESWVRSYSPINGRLLWSTPLDRVGLDLSSSSDAVLVSEGDAGVASLDPLTGRLRWQTTLVSPGKGGRYTEPGAFQGFTESSPGGPVVGFIVAEEPYRD